MAYKSYKDRLAELSAQVNQLRERFEQVSANLATKTHELLLLKEFGSLESGVYINTQLGKGTVLNALPNDQYKGVRIFVGQGDSAKILSVRYWQYTGKL